ATIGRRIGPAPPLANTAKLNGALNGMWTGGSFPFASGGAGPILRPIVAAAKEFYFKGTIKTSRKIGGALIGSMLSRGFSTTSSSYQFPNLHPYPNLMGGAQTRFTRLDGQNGGAVLRLRGSGFHVQGIEFKGQKYYYGAPEGTATPSGIEVEGN